VWQLFVQPLEFNLTTREHFFWVITDTGFLPIRWNFVYGINHICSVGKLFDAVDISVLRKDESIIPFFPESGYSQDIKPELRRGARSLIGGIWEDIRLPPVP